MFENHTFRRLFLSYVLLLTFVVVLLSASIFRSNTVEMRKEKESADQAAVQELVGFVDASIASIKLFSESLNNTPWVHKLYFDLETLNQSFTPIRRREISREFSLYRSSDLLLQRLYLIYPYRNILITNNSWMSIQTGFNYIGLPLERHDEFLETIRNTTEIRQLHAMEEALSPDAIIVLSPLEEIAVPRAYLCYFIDADRLRAEINIRMPSNMIEFSVYQNERAVLKVSETDGEGDGKTESIDSGVLNWRYDYSFSDDLNDFGYYKLINTLMTFAAIVIVCGMGAAWLLSTFTYRPLRQLLAKLKDHRAPGAPARGNDYSVIGEIYDKIINERDAFSRIDTIRQLLQGYFDLPNAQEHIRSYAIPFSDDDYFQVHLIEIGERASDDRETTAAFRRMFVDLRHTLIDLRCELSDTLYGKPVLIVASANPDALRRSDEMMRTYMENDTYLAHCTLFTGEISQGIIGISIAYQHALDKYVYLNRRISAAQYYFPAEWESQLIIALNNANFPVVQRILGETRRENQRRLAAGTIAPADCLILLSSIAVTIYRNALEMGIDLTELLESMEGMRSIEAGWEMLLKACERICPKVPSIPAQDRDPVVAYVEENYANPDLSLDILTEKFQLSAPTIIKIFKQNTNETFYPYLLRLRIERAKELLTEGGSTVEVANAVGYENEMSFRRAFIRRVGISPREYADGFKAAK